MRRALPTPWLGDHAAYTERMDSESIMRDFQARHRTHSGLALRDRLQRKIEMQRSIQLSPEELDWLVASGAYRTFVESVLSELEARARGRLEARGYTLSSASTDGDAPAGSDTKAAGTDNTAAAATLEAAPPRSVFDPAQLAERWGIPRTAVYAAIKSGKLRAFKLGAKLYRVRLDAVEEYERAHGGS